MNEAIDEEMFEAALSKVGYDAGQSAKENEKPMDYRTPLLDPFGPQNLVRAYRDGYYKGYTDG